MTSEGSIFIDRSPELFAKVLQGLRAGRKIVTDSAAEARANALGSKTPEPPKKCLLAAKKAWSSGPPKVLAHVSCSGYKPQALGQHSG